MSKLTLTFILGLWTWLSLMPESRADICMHDNAEEELYLSNTQEPQDCAWQISEAAIKPSYKQSRALPYQAIIATAAQTASIEPALLHAVINAESSYQPHAVSPRGAKGLMQLMPATAHQLGVSNPYDPVQNIMAGARYLGQLQKQFNGDLPLALAAYNAGPGAVIRHGNTIPPYAETKAYVPRVLQVYQQLKASF